MNNIKQKVASVFFQAGITAALIRLQRFLPTGGRNTFHILNYHRVNDFNDPFTIDSVSATDFDSQMRYVAAHYHVLSLDDIYDRNTHHTPLPNQCLAITFDDGYADNYTFAYPILKKYDLPATIFLTVECVNNQTPLWFDKVLSAFKETRKKQFFCPLKKDVFDIQDNAQKLSKAHATLEGLKKTGHNQRKKIIEKILFELDISFTNEQHNRSNLLTWSWIKKMAQDNISFGSHTMTHPILAWLPDEDLEWELTESRRIIEKNIDKEVLFFAYPNGKASDFNEKVSREVKEAGYKAAVTTEPVINTPKTDTFTWGRYKPWQNQVEHFSMALFMHGFSR